MPGAVRIVFQPKTHLIDDRVAVLGATLELARFGKMPSQLKLDQEHDAKLTFHAGFLTEARKISKPDFSAFATLSGKVKLQGSEPRLTLSPDAAIVYTGTEAEQPRRLRLAYGSSFVNQAAEAAVSELKLPEVPEDAVFFELGVELEVDGAKEAALDANDRLDVPLESISFFEAEVLDEEEQPLANRDFQVELPDGSVVDVKSDGAGVVRVDPVPGGACVLRIVDR